MTTWGRIRARLAEEAVSPSVAAAQGLALWVNDDASITEYVLYHPTDMLRLWRSVQGSGEGDVITALLPAVYGMMVVAGRDGNTGWGADEVLMSAAKHGYGPMLYDIVMAKEGGLMADRSSVSPAAKRVWDYYKSRRPDVVAKPLDDMKRPKTPPRFDDARHHRGGVANALNYAYFMSDTPDTHRLAARHRAVTPALAKAKIDDDMFSELGRALFHEAP